MYIGIFLLSVHLTLQQMFISSDPWYGASQSADIKPRCISTTTRLFSKVIESPSLWSISGWFLFQHRCYRGKWQPLHYVLHLPAALSHSSLAHICWLRTHVIFTVPQCLAAPPIYETSKHNISTWGGSRAYICVTKAALCNTVIAPLNCQQWGKSRSRTVRGKQTACASTWTDCS